MSVMFPELRRSPGLGQMNKHRQVLAAITGELTKLDPGCSILLAGSMASGEEREDSDIDIFVFFSREPDPQCFNDLIAEDNRARWHVYTEREGIPVDIGWKLLDSLPDHIPDDAEMAPYPVVHWKIMRDPSGKVERWIEAVRHWLDHNAWVKEVWGKQLAEMRRHKRDPSYPLQYDEKEFHAYLRTLVAQRRKDCLQQPRRSDSEDGASHP